MDQVQLSGERPSAAERPQESGAAALGRGGRMSRQRKAAAVLRLLRGEDLETVSRSQGGYGAPITHLLYVRVERGRDARTIEFEAPADLVAALEWFRQLPSLAAAAHLRASA